MSKKRLTSFIIAFFLLLSIVVPAFSYETAQPSRENLGSSYNDLINRLNENIHKQNELRNKIAAAKNQERTLAAELEYTNNQIELTSLEVEEVKDRLSQLAIDIGEVSNQLGETNEDISYTTTISNERIRALYQQSYIQPAEVFLGSSSFNDFLIRQKYTEAIRSQDINLLESLKKLKQDYNEQKDLLVNKKNKENALKKELQGKVALLNNQRGEKEYLLGVTKNNEATYKKLLAQVQTEIESIARAIGGGGVRIGPVRKGDVIAFQGNSGCSTGTHVHFGVYKNAAAVNPITYLNSGYMRWPLANPTVTQWFGENYSWYMKNFGMPGHNGIDMAEYYGAPIYAAASGTAYLSSDGSACWLTGTVGKGIVIDHGGGLKSIYWHIR